MSDFHPAVGLLILAAVVIALLLIALLRTARRAQPDSGSASRTHPWPEPHRTPEDQIINHATFIMDHMGRVLSWNPAVQRILGYDKGEFIGRPVADLYTPEDQMDGAPARDLAEAAMRGRVNHEGWVLRKDGSRLPASVSTASVLDREGNLAGFSRRVRDLTETKRVEEELGRSKEALDLASEAAGLGTWDHDLATGELQWDARAKALFGYPSDAPGTYRTWVEAIHPDDLLTAEETLERSLRERQPLSTQYRVVWPDGSVHWLAVIGRASYGPSGKALRMRGILLDITERKRTEERLQEVLRLEAISRLAGGIAHDLNNMLVAILGFSDLLAESLGSNDPRLEDVKQISQAATRSADLTRQLLAFARRELIQPRRLDLNSTIRYAGGMLRPVLGENVSLNLQLASTATPIHADPGRVEQILMNLVLNSRDAMPQGGRVTVQTDLVVITPNSPEWRAPSEAPPPGRYVRLTVTDTGHGMDEITLQHIWEPFFTTKPAGKGTGLGLSVVYGSVKQSGGFVRVDSEVGSGTAVQVFWPEFSQEVETVAEASPPSVAQRGKERVLVVEDEPVVRALVVRSLRGLGYACLEASSAEEALRLLAQEENRVELVITDVVMPGISGGDLGSRIAERYPELRVLYTSGFADDEMVRRGLLEATRPFLQKPFTPLDLGRKVREVLDAPAGLLEAR